MASSRWKGDAFRAKLQAEMRRRVEACLVLGANQTKQLLSVDGTGRAPATRGPKGRFKKGRLRYGANPSAPGEPPHLQTGRLRGSIAWAPSVSKGVVRGRYGTNVKYALPLEKGAPKAHLAARPFLARSYRELKARFQTILRAPIK
jgi:hypothetical protein